MRAIARPRHGNRALLLIRRIVALALLLFGTMTLAMAARAQSPGREPRLALVIANGDYRAADRLTATYDDGDKIAAALSATGFIDASGEGAVRSRRNLDQAGMLAEIATLKARLTAAGPGSFGVLYFSGHGAAFGSGSEVVMLGTDFGPASLASASALSRATVTRDLMESGARTILVVLDMCRNTVNIPASLLTVAPSVSEEGGARSAAGSKGLKRLIRNDRIRPDQGYLVAFSTSADRAAFDDGIFSRILAEEIRRPQQTIADAMKRASDRVALSSGKSFQKPTFDYGLQGQPPCFVSCDQSAGDRFYDCANCPWMRPIPAGGAVIGSPLSEAGRHRDEPVQRRDSIGYGFALGVYEVTVAEWTACVRDGACPKLGTWARDNPNPLIPATGISYVDTQSFLTWVSAQSGRKYRLPTEEEWEYASRAGATSAFPWGEDITPSDANYDQTARYRNSPVAPYRGYPEAVNAYPPNAFGLYQMQGNVWEWTSGCLVSSCQQKVVRGGSFESAPGEIRSANRFGIAASKRRQDTGLRVARDLDPDEIGGAP